MQASLNFLLYFENSQLRDFLLVFIITLIFLWVGQSWIIYGSKSSQSDPYRAYNSLPGPRPFPLNLIGNGLLFLYKDDLLQKLVDMAKEYGPYYKLTIFNEDIVVLNSPEASQALMMSNDWGHVRRGRLLERACPKEVFETMVLYKGGEKWKKMRKVMSIPFKHKALKQHNHCFHKQSERMVKQLEKRFKGGNGEHIDILVDLLKQCTFGISSETLMGVDLEDMEYGASFCENLDLVLELLTERAYRPWLLIPWIWQLTSNYRRMHDARTKCLNVTLKVLEKYREKINLGQSDANELSDTMIEVMCRNGIDERLIFNEVAMMLGAGNETTPSAAEQVLFNLSLHPNHQILCRQEIDQVYSDQSKRKNDVLEFEALKELKHLERCINETLRIQPLTIIMRQLESPLRINEKLVIPTGVSVVMPPYALHHLPQYYPNPEKYDPDRFLPEQVQTRHPFCFTPFSAGQRGCIAMKLAMIELKVMVATILRNFEVETPDKKEDIKLVIDPTIKPSKPIRFTVKKRNLIV